MASKSTFHYTNFEGCNDMRLIQINKFALIHPSHAMIGLEIFSQIIGDTIEQNLRVLQAQRGFVFDSGFQESKKSSPSQVLGCGYGLM